jgi:hypothetical protein
MLFVDIFDTPFAILALLITITIWRAFHMWSCFAKLKTRNERRKLVIVQFLYWLLDIPTSIAACLVFITLYRARRLYLNLKDVRRAFACTNFVLVSE